MPQQDGVIWVVSKITDIIWSLKIREPVSHFQPVIQFLLFFTVYQYELESWEEIRIH